VSKIIESEVNMSLLPLILSFAIDCVALSLNIISRRLHEPYKDCMNTPFESSFISFLVLVNILQEHL